MWRQQASTTAISTTAKTNKQDKQDKQDKRDKQNEEVNVYALLLFIQHLLLLTFLLLLLVDQHNLGGTG